MKFDTVLWYLEDFFTGRLNMPNKKLAGVVVVAGDVTMDWNTATSLGTKKANPNWSQDIELSLFWQRGFHYGPKTDEKLKTHNVLLPYAELSEDLKEQNRQNGRDIPSKLASSGYSIIPARSNEPPFNFPGEPLKVPAEEEHERWMQSKLDDGWTYAPETDRAKKLHKRLVPWKKLTEEEKEKERVLVRGIPEILARAGYAIVRSNN
jgi:hypothetical protein